MGGVFLGLTPALGAGIFYGGFGCRKTPDERGFLEKPKEPNCHRGYLGIPLFFLRLIFSSGGLWHSQGHFLMRGPEREL